MEIKTRTKLNYQLAVKFNIGNLFYGRKFNLVIFPLIMLASALIIWQSQQSFGMLPMILIIIAIMMPLLLIGINIIMFSLNAKKDSNIMNGVIAEYVFNNKSFTIQIGDGEVCMPIPYEYVKNLVEFKDYFVLYFNGAKPILIDKYGYFSSDIEDFRQFMRESIDKKCVFKKKRKF